MRRQAARVFLAPAALRRLFCRGYAGSGGGLLVRLPQSQRPGARLARAPQARAAAAASEEEVVKVSKQRHESLLGSEIVHFQRALEPHPISLQQILALRDAEKLRLFLLEELPIRFAHRLTMVESLPDWHSFPHMRMIRTLYSNSFQRLRVVSKSDAELFRSTLQTIKRRNSNMLQHVVRGVRSMKEASPALGDDRVNDFLDSFLTARIGSEILSSQYLALTNPGGPTSAIDPLCDPLDIIHQAAGEAARLCRHYYDGYAAPVHVSNAQQVRFPFIPQYLRYIMFEILKNSMRAVAERYPGQEAERHPISVVVCGDEDSVVVRVSDEGGGISVRDVPKIWSYLFTTAKPQGQTNASSVYDDSDSDSEEESVAPMAGFGCGLPLSRNYASYVGGSLQLNAVPDHGVDVYLYMNRLGNAREYEGKGAKLGLGLPSRGYILH